MVEIGRVRVKSGNAPIEQKISAYPHRRSFSYVVQKMGVGPHRLHKLSPAVMFGLHIWAMSTNETALTAHLIRPGGLDDTFLARVCDELSHRFKITCATLQIEAGNNVCKLAPAEVI
jgi:hypothetical protein